MSIQSYEDVSSIQLLLHNLDLLGFDPRHDASNIAFENVVFDTNLFTHHVDTINHRAFECISYFLFRQMDPALTKIKFASCWPIHEHSTSGRNYRMAAHRWLLDLQARGLLLGHPTLPQSYFETCQGDAVINILMTYSVLVLQTVMDRDLADPRGRPIRLAPSYTNNNNSMGTASLVKRASPTIPTCDPAAIEKKLQGAIQALAHYTHQQKEDFSKVVEKARRKAIVLKQQIDDERNRPLSTLDQQDSNTVHLPPDLTKIRKRIATLRDDQQRKLQKLQLIHHQERRNQALSSQKKWTPLEETALQNAIEFEQMQALLLNDDDDVSHGVDRTTQDNQHYFTLPSLMPSLDSDPTEAIKRIQDLVQLQIHGN